jgi:hypothetical protein
MRARVNIEHLLRRQGDRAMRPSGWGEAVLAALLYRLQA